MQSVPITTNVLSSNPVHGEMYSIHHYVIKFVSVLQQVGPVIVLRMAFDIIIDMIIYHNI
jgi:hypothetical protein